MFSFFHKKNVVTNLEWLGTDIHSNLLPGIHEGSPGLMDAVAYIKELSEKGIAKIHCTPSVTDHNYQGLITVISSAKENLEKALKKAGISIAVTTGAKYLVDEKFKVVHDLITLPGKYILLELSPLKEPRNLEEIIFDLQILGYKVILAGPELYSYYHHNRFRYNRLKELGVFFQLNLLSVMGHYGKAAKNATDFLLEKKHYELAGTEALDENHLSLLLKNVTDGAMFHDTTEYAFRNKDLFG